VGSGTFPRAMLAREGYLARRCLELVDLYLAWRATPPKVNTVTAPGTGMRWAHLGDYRVAAYSNADYCRMRWVPAGDGGKWCLLPEGEEMPEEVERALCAALAIPCRLDHGRC